MANGSNKDVVLRIKSQSDAEKAFRDIADAIEETQKQLGLLNKGAGAADASVEDLAASFKAIEAASAKLDSASNLDKYFRDVGRAAIAAQAKLTQLRGELEKVAQRNAKLKEGGDVTKEQQREYERLQKSVKEANAALEKQLAIYKQLKAAGGGTFTARVADLKVDVARATAAEAATRKIIQARKAEEAVLIEKFGRQKQIYDKLNADERRLSDTVERESKRRNASRKSEAAAARGVGTGATSGASPFKIDTSGARQTLDFFQRLRGQLLAVGSAYVGVYGAINQFNEALAQQRALAGVQARLSTSLGTDDAKVIGAELEFIRQQADRLGLAFVPLADNFSRFQAAAVQAGAGLSETRVIFTRIAEAGRVLNLSTEDVQGTFRALEQIFSKGKVQAEELRSQLGDRLPGAVAILAKAIGKPQAELTKLLETGQITSDVLLDFANKVGDAYGAGLGKATEGLAAELARTENIYADLRDEFVREFEPFLIDMLKDLRQVLASPEFKSGVRSIAVGLGELTKVIPFLVQNLNLVVGAFVALSAPRLIGALGFIVTWGKQATAMFALFRTGAIAAAGAMKTFTTIAKGLVSATGLGLLAVIGYEIYDAFTDTKDVAGELNSELEAQKGQLADLAYAEQLRTKEAEQRLQIEQELAEIQNRVRAAENATGGAVQFVNEQDDTRKLDTLGKKLKETADNYDQRVEQVKKATADAIRSLQDLAVPTQGAGEDDAAFNARLEAEAKARVDKQIQLGVAERDALIALEKQKQDQLRFLRAEAAKADIEERKKQQDTALVDLDNFAKKVLDKTADLKEKTGDGSAAEARAAAINAEFEDQLRDLDRLKERLEKFAPGTVKPEFLENLRKQIELQRTLTLEEDKMRRSREASEKSAKRLSDAEDSLNQLLSIRQMRLEEIEAQQQSGILTQQQAQEATRDLYAEANNQIIAQIKYILTLGNLTAEQTVKYEILLKQIQRSSKEADDFFMGLNRAQLQEQAADGLTDAFFEWADGIKSAREALRDFASEFLRFIAEAIIKQQILNLLKTMGVFHSGGIAGSASRTRQVNPMAFLAAPRYHTGGVAGLAPNEVPAILQRGEEVLTRDDPRHIMNGGGQTGGAAPAQQPQNISVINTIDADSVFQAGASTPGGSRVILNVLQANKAAVKQLLA